MSEEEATAHPNFVFTNKQAYID
jgi:hypothetical protein